MGGRGSSDSPDNWLQAHRVLHCPAALRNNLSAWVKQAELDAGLRSDGLTTAEREELRRLRRENRILREEREIRTPPQEVLRLSWGPLGQAAAFFAQRCGGGGLPRA